MKVPRKQHLHVFTKLHNRLSSVKWTLLLITTAMFFLSAASTGCPTGGYTLSVAPNLGPSVSNPPAPESNLPPPSPNGPASIQPMSASASAPAIPVVIPATPEGSVVSNPPAVAAPPVPSGSAGLSPVVAPPPAAPVVAPPPAAPVAAPPPAAPVAAPPPAAGGAAITVMMITDTKNPSGFGFKPETMTISKGTTVTWVNVTAIPHTVTSDDGKFKSSDIASPVMQGQKYSFVFVTAGTFKYHCAIHPPQIGTITVQ